MTVEIKSDGSLFDDFFRLKHEIIKKYGVEPRGDIRNATAEKMLIEQAYLKGYIDGKAEAMQWIPCGKEKPRGGENIATVKWYDGTIEVVHAYYDGFGWITGCGERAEVIAWMPLPEPYKEV